MKNASVILLFFCSFMSLSAQQGHVEEEVDAIGGFLSDQGYFMSRSPDYFRLKPGMADTISLQLDAMQHYNIWGVADENCQDLDLLLLDASGNEVDVDILNDNRPLINPVNLNTGTYSLVVTMHLCKTADCEVGVLYYSQIAVDNSGETPEEIVENQLNSLVNNMTADGFSQAFDNEYSWLGQGEERMIELDLVAGNNYQIWGVCDGDCTNLYLSLTDPSGSIIAEPSLEDSLPSLNIINVETGKHTLRVNMRACSIEPCYTAITLFSR